MRARVITSRAPGLDRVQSQPATSAPKAPLTPSLITSIIVPFVVWTLFSRGVVTSSAAERGLGLSGTHRPNTNIFSKSTLLGPLYILLPSTPFPFTL